MDSYTPKTQMEIITKMLNISFEIVSIEGNIGSGKSTLCNMLKRYFKHYNLSQYKIKYHFIDEPVKEWETIQDSKQGNKNMLQLFYEDQDKYSFVFQTTAYITRLQNIRNIMNRIINQHYEEQESTVVNRHYISDEPVKHILITERSLQTDRNVFAKMLYNNNKISEIEWQSYNYWFDNFVKEYGATRFVYVKAPPSTAHARVQKRSRDGEEGIPLDYLDRCHSYHEQWLDNIDESNIHMFDSSVELNTNDFSFDYIESVLKFIV